MHRGHHPRAAMLADDHALILERAELAADGFVRHGQVVRQRGDRQGPPAAQPRDDLVLPS